MAIKIRPANVAATLAALKNKWKEVAPGTPFEFYFLGDSFNRQYITEERLSQIFSYFSLLAIFIVCLGLFGMATYSVEHRTKEIGIRKVMGATHVSLLLHLNKDFAKLFIFANLVAWPLAYMFANR
jgi:putative ABC transport system permease protein